MNRTIGYPEETRLEAVQMYNEHRKEYSSQWKAILAVSAKVGCTPETVRRWIQRDTPRTASSKADVLEHEIAELKHTNELLRQTTELLARAMDKGLKA